MMDKKPATERSMMAMWIASAVIVVLILGGMGIGMLMHNDPTTDIWGRQITEKKPAPQ